MKIIYDQETETMTVIFKSVAEIESGFRPPEAGRRGGDINRFWEPERGVACGASSRRQPT